MVVNTSVTFQTNNQKLILHLKTFATDQYDYYFSSHRANSRSIQGNFPERNHTP